MREVKQTRLTRELAGLLLKSTLSEKELADLCHDILDSGDILNEVAINILNLIEPNVRGSFRSVSNYPEHVQEEAHSAYNWLKKKGITKDKLFMAMSMFSPNLDEFIHKQNPTIKDAMEYFIGGSSKSEFNHFMGSFEDDEFIRMIEGK